MSYDINDPDVISIIDDLPLWSAPFGIKLLEEVDYKKNIKVLDIGSGTGFPAVELASRLGDSSVVYCIDPWKQALDRAELKARKWGLKNIRFFEAVAEQLQFENDFFDLVISNNGINNVRDDKKCFEEIKRVSKQGAQLVITVNLPDSMIEFYNLFRLVLEKHRMSSEIEKLEDHIYEKRKPLKYTSHLVEEAGFRINKIIEDRFAFYYSDGTSFLNHFLIKLAFKDSWIKILPENKVQTIFGNLEMELNKAAEKEGRLKITIPYVCISAEKK